MLSMFDEWKKAWRDAVDNFRREAGLAEAGAGAAGAVREVYGARAALRQLELEARRAARELAREREEEETCRRRESMAARIGDAETARIAADHAARHSERAQILARKVEVLEAELGLRTRELREMETMVAAAGGDTTADAPPRSVADPGAREREDTDFHRMERAARERAAEARLEELKRRMQ